MLRNKKVLMLLSLLIAVGLWVYVMGNVDPDTKVKISGVKVEMQGTESLEKQDLHPVLNSPKIVSVTIQGKRTQVNKTKKKGLEAYIDVSTCNYGRNETEIYVQLPQGVTNVSVENISKETAIFTVK